MENNPLVSFVLPAYKATFMRQAIDSILAQSYTNFELIIVDDASPENLDVIISEYTDVRIRHYKNRENIGGKNLVLQWNHCIEYAKGEYMVLASDDDLYSPDFLQDCMCLAVKYPEVDLIRARVEQIDINNKIIGTDSLLPEYTNKYEYLHYWMSGGAFVCIGNYMFRTSEIKKRKFIDFPCAFGSDSASTIMMSDKGVANTSRMLFKFRISSIHLSSSRNHLKEKIEANTLLFKWLKNLNYKEPSAELDCYYSRSFDAARLYSKCRYDYYNLVIKYLPFYRIYYIQYCELINSKDKLLMFLRFCFDKIFR